MKKNIALALCLLGLFSSCKKENAFDKFDNLETGAYLTLNDVVNTNIDYAALNTTSAAIKVGGVGTPIDQVAVYVVDQPTLDVSKWKKIKTVPFSEGVTLEVKATELATALGVQPAELSPGSTYYFYNEILTKDGRTININNMDPDFEGQAGYNMGMRWSATVVCPYNESAFSSGTFEIVTDEWHDFNPGDEVSVVPGPGPNQLTLTVYPNPSFGQNRKSFVVDVDPATGTAEVAHQIYGDYGSDKDLAVESTGANYVFAWTGVIQLLLEHSYPPGVIGNYALVIRKR